MPQVRTRIGDAVSKLDPNEASESVDPSPGVGQAPPQVWLITAYRAGEKSQIQGLAEALGWPFEFRRVVHRRFGAAFDLLRGDNLLGIDRRRSEPLAPPWPDLVIAAGMRNEPVARWIRAQSGGRTRLVQAPMCMKR